MAAKPNQPDNKPDDDEGLPFFSHLTELRDRLVRSVIVVAIICAGLFYFANDIYTFIARPMLEQLTGHNMLATKPASTFFIPFKLTFFISIFLAVPFLLYQIWSFVAPGLYKHEKRLAVPLLVSSTLLFYIGMTFAYYVVFPLIFKFFAGTAPEGVDVRPDISEYLDLVLGLFFAFGAAFEVPIATILCVIIGVVTPDDLAKMRRYIIVAAFIISMLLTPPDVMSQFLLAIPMWLLFELGLFISRFIVKEQSINKEPDGEQKFSHTADDEEFKKVIAEQEAILKKTQEDAQP